MKKHAEIILGTWPLSGDFGKKKLKDIEDILRYAFDSGIKSFDTAPNYGNGFSELCLGMVFAGEPITVYTKFGNHPFIGKDFSNGALRNSFECSLKRLRQDKVQGVFLHNPRKELNSYENAFELFDELKSNDLIKEAGISGAKGFKYDAKVMASIDIFQQDANVLYLDELNSKDTKKLKFFARSPLATGILSGSLTKDTTFPSDDHRSAWLKGERLVSLIKRLDILKEMTQGKISLPSLARRFLLYHSSVNCMVLGVSKKYHITDILADIEQGPLPEEITTQIVSLYENDYGLKNEKHLSY